MRTNPSTRRLAYFLLLVLQFTMLQWSMQGVAAGVGEVGMAVCLAADPLPVAGHSTLREDGHHDCCHGPMQLDCMYHCSAGAFAFIGHGTIPTPLPLATPFLIRQAAWPEPVCARTLFRPPRHILT